jgi:hypothetical protein
MVDIAEIPRVPAKALGSSLDPLIRDAGACGRGEVKARERDLRSAGAGGKPLW